MANDMVDRRKLLLGAAGISGAVLLAGCGDSKGSIPQRTSSPQGTTTPQVKVREPGDAVERGKLKVPGAELYYEVRGEGPLLLMIHGGVVDAGCYADIAPILAEKFQVVTYDRRGNSRSRLTQKATEMRVGQQADDAAALAGKFADEPPHVFGNSGGAIVALEVAARYGTKLRGVIAHEPPVSEVLPDATRWRRMYESARRTYQRSGVAEGFAEFMRIDPGAEDPDGDGGGDEGFGRRIQPNQEFLLRYEMLPFIRYRPRIAELTKLGDNLVIGVGHFKAPMMTRAVQTLANSLGTKVVEFPGDHTGFMPHPAEFAAKIRTILE